MAMANEGLQLAAAGREREIRRTASSWLHVTRTCARRSGREALLFTLRSMEAETTDLVRLGRWSEAKVCAEAARLIEVRSWR